MPQKTGTFDIGSLLAATNISAVQYGLNTISEVLAQDNANYNELVAQALTDLCAPTTDRLRVAGSSIGGDMQEVDEYSRPPSQKDLPSYFIGFPLRKYQFAVGWTKQWERKKTPNDFAVAQQAAQGADLRRLRALIQLAIYTPTNATFSDLHVDKASLPVKAFINADGTAIQNGPNGEVFDGTTHTHYDANATLTAAVALALINDVVEHGFSKGLKIFINLADEAAWRALTGFQAYLDPRVSVNANANQAVNDRLDITRLDNRPIGIFGAAEVWLKPWAIANYAFCTATEDIRKPLCSRTDPDSPDGLHFEAAVETFPLRGEYQERMIGFGVWNRLNGAVLQFNNGSYTAPTITF